MLDYDSKQPTAIMLNNLLLIVNHNTVGSHTANIRYGMIQKGNDMQLYECVFIIRQDLSSSQVETITNEFCAIITDNKGSVVKQEYWGLKTLAYKIKKNRKGHYIMLNFEADAATVAEFDRRMGLHEDILRVLIVAIDAVDPEPSIMMQNKTERSSSDAGDASAA